MKLTAILLVMLLASSCLVAQWTLHVPGGYYVTTWRMGE